MPVAISGGPILFDRFTVATAADLIAAVNARLQSVGWTSAAVTGGYRLQGTSPQGHAIYLYVRDKGHQYFDNPYYYPQVTFNFTTTDGVYVGMDHDVKIRVDYTYQIVCQMCQLFLSVVGVVNEPGGSTFCGGVPFAPLSTACGGEIPAGVTPASFFWANGNGSGDVSLRGSLIVNNTLAQSEALWGTDYCAAGNTVGSLRLPTLTTAPAIFNGLNLPSPVLWWNGDFLTIEPMLTWGLTSAALPKIRAQIWDAMIFSKQMAMDARTTARDGYNWINFTDQYLYGGLNLIVPAATFDEGNYAFIST